MKAVISRARVHLVATSLFIAALAIAVIGAYPARAADPTATAIADEQVIRHQAEDFARSYGAADATAIANMWTDDCSFTDEDGQRYVGRKAILKLYEELFRESVAQPLTVNIESIVFPSPDVCLEEGTTTLGKSGSNSRYNVVHVKRGTDWKMLSVVESKCEQVSTDSLKDLDWFVGDWTSKTDEHAVHLHVTQISNGNFLSVKFSDTEDGKDVPQDFEIIGWDATSRRVVSWHFGGNGGFGFGRWYRDGSTWINHTHGATTDGANTSATYIYKQVDKDQYTWSSVDRVVNGHKLSDRQNVQVTRDPVVVH